MLPAPTQIGPYRIVRLLGEGGMGQVFEAIHDEIERRAAIKVLSGQYAQDREATKRLFNEARAVNRIEHPNIVQISEYGHTTDGRAYLVMEFLRGESLGHRLDRLAAKRERISLAEVLHIAWQTADALAAAHGKGIVHRDIKPDNLMLVPDPVAPGGERVKVLDFGIARLAGAGGRATATHAVMGTPLYMSPEQCRGAGEIDERTDVYSLGVVFYEMIAGRPPFISEGGGELIGSHLFREPPQLDTLVPQVPPSLAALIHRLLVKDKEKRPRARQMAAEIERLQSLLPEAAPPGRSASHHGRRMSEGPDGGDETRISRVPASTMGRSSGELKPRARSRYALGLGGLLAVVTLAAIGFSRVGIIGTHNKAAVTSSAGPIAPPAASKEVMATASARSLAPAAAVSPAVAPIANSAVANGATTLGAAAANKPLLASPAPVRKPVSSLHAAPKLKPPLSPPSQKKRPAYED